jgi:hypothetical protein
MLDTRKTWQKNTSKCLSQNWLKGKSNEKSKK